jgi:RHS repeat-associated protein
MGCSLGISGISRKTSNGIPRYDHTDVFVFGGAELEIKLNLDKATGEWLPDVRLEKDWQVINYRPRVEAAFDLIEYWQENNGENSYWVVTSAGNQQTVYGITAAARVASKEYPGNIFSWLPEEEKDDKGNIVQYQYEYDEQDNYSYLKTISYGNYADGKDIKFAFTSVVDYGTFDVNAPDTVPVGYMERPDPFSSFVSGFEVRNNRLVYNLLLYHTFAGQNGGNSFLVKVMTLQYGSTDGNGTATEPLSGLSFLRSILLTGYTRQNDGSYITKTVPPVEMAFTPFLPLQQQYRELQVRFAANIPGYLDAGSYQITDLNNDGLPGFLYSNASTSFYYEPLGDGQYGAPVELKGFPAERDLRAGSNVLMSLSGNGVKELVVETEGRSGYYENTSPGMWQGFEAFASQASEAFAAGKQWVDLTGDGLADLVFFEQDTVKFYPSLRTLGYGAATQVPLAEGFPATDNNSEEEMLMFADMLGDGLQHYIRIRNGSVECWPSLGYGRFGSVRRLHNAPYIDAGMDVRRLRLADIDGSGTADIIYMEHDYVKIWFNQSGNGFSAPVIIPLPVNYDQLSQLSFADVNGTGTTCLIITVAEPEVRHYYYDFAGNTKPYLLATSKNNIGTTATYTYTTSVKQYLRDKRRGRPWPTRLFFPVHVVAATEILDEPSGAYHIQRFAYHDGYYDPVEREFRGFGFVETWDTDHFAAYSAGAARTGFPVNTVNEELHVPPVYTKSWYHNGAYAPAGRTTIFYEQEYYSGDEQFYSITGQVLERPIIDADAETLKQAYVCMAGQLLRQEVYGLDGTDVMGNPYTVSETEICIRLVQPRDERRYAIFLPYVRQSMNWQYERNPADPRVTHSFSLLVNEWGAATRSCSVYYPRRAVQSNIIFKEQQELKITLSSSRYVSGTQRGSYYINVPFEAFGYEITGVALPETGYFSFSDIEQDIQKTLANIINYHAAPPGDNTVPAAILNSWQQQYYRDSEQANALQLGSIGTPLLSHHSEVAVYPEDTFNKCYNGRLTASQILADTGYIVHDDYYWNAGLTQYYLTRQGYYLPLKQQNDFAPEGNISLQPISSVGYDIYYMCATTSTVALTGTDGITTISAIDYCTMQAWQVTDPNGNVSEIMFDPLGYVIVSTAYGTIAGKNVGFLPISSYQATAEPASAADVLANPQQYLQNAGSYFYYDLYAWVNRAEPVCSVALAPQLYTSQLKDGQDNPIKIGVAFSDGMSRALASKTNTDAGTPGLHDRDGNWVYTQRGENKTGDMWICTGRTVYNNKGNPAQQFQPYFSTSWEYEQVDALISEKEIVPPAVLHYDALSRLIRTDNPKGFFTKTTFTPWDSKQFDVNDTILDSSYYQAHKGQVNKIKSNAPAEGASLPQTEADALKQAIACYNSPSVSVYDTMGRSVRGMADNLGAITEAKLMPVLGTGDAVQAALSALEVAGWIVLDSNKPGVYWLTDFFQPYTEGFAATFTIGGDSSAALLDLLKQGRLTTLQVYDIQGRSIESLDPRLLWSNLTTQTSYFNFRSLYTMGGGIIETKGADAGSRISLANMFSAPVYYWDVRGFQVTSVYDQMQRQVQTIVSGGDGAFTGSRIAWMTIFGELALDAAANNLIGRPWKVFDDAGAIITDAYGLAGESIALNRYFRADYKISADWISTAQDDVQGQTPFYSFAELNALGLPVRSINPDGSIYLPGYNIAGQLSKLDMVFAESAAETDSLPAPVTIVKRVEYDAFSRPVFVEYGNGTATRDTIEATTQRLLNRRSYRTGKPKKGTDPRLQEIHYTYDPAGNITARRDNSWENVFNANQRVEPLSHYTYNLIYQLIYASGRQMQSAIGDNKAEMKFMLENHIPIKVSNPADAQALENYTEKYTYDDAGNLTQLKHNATRLWTWAYITATDNNRLALNGQKAMAYDANGNLETLGNLASVTWNYKNQLAQAMVIERKNAEPDAEYYQYDSGGSRVRKVTERLINGGTQKEIEEKYYLGPYQYKRIILVATGEGKSTPTPVVLLEKQSLKITGPAGLCCISNYWTKDATGRETKKLQRTYRYQYSDVLNSVGLEVNEAGKLLSYEEYYPYGVTAFTVAPNALEVSLKEYRYSGQEKDNFTGLYYYGMRYYPPWLCRWVNPDPAGTIDGLNLYAFVGGNPVTHYDVGGMVRGKNTSQVGTKRNSTSQGNKNPSKKFYLDAEINQNEIASYKTMEPEFETLGKQIGNEIKKSKTKYKKYFELYTSMTKDDFGDNANLLSIHNDEQDDDKLDQAFASAIHGKKTEFKRHYRATHPNQDEHLSCNAVFHLIKGAASVGLAKEDKAELREAIRIVSRFRLPTVRTGVSIVNANNNMQHSTGGKPGLYMTDDNSGASQHNFWDRYRAYNVALEDGNATSEKGVWRLFKMSTAVLTYTLTSAYPRSNASNIAINPNMSISNKEHDEFNGLRENAKALYYHFEMIDGHIPYNENGLMTDPYKADFYSKEPPTPLYRG